MVSLHSTEMWSRDFKLRKLSKCLTLPYINRLLDDTCRKIRQVWLNTKLRFRIGMYSRYHEKSPLTRLALGDDIGSPIPTPCIPPTTPKNHNSSPNTNNQFPHRRIR